MKNLLFIFFTVGIVNTALAQKSYIQVTGEPNLSVYLNNQFKGKTTAEYNGYIIENVNPGNHVIKISKEGYTPFEEQISVKAGEVFAYKVKPFTKHAVTISQQGNTGEADKQVEARTGKLIIQSVPIEIKITIPSIEGVKNSAKLKDEWIVNEIPVGRYTVEMTYGSKTVKKQVEITEDDITTAFVNMLSGEFKSETILSPKKKKEKIERYFISMLNQYKVRRAATPAIFFSQTPASAMLQNYQEKENHVWIQVPEKAILKNPSLTPGARFLMYDRKSVSAYTYAIKGFEDYESGIKAFNEAMDEFKNNLDEQYVQASVYSALDKAYEFNVYGQRTRIGYELKQIGKTHYELRINFGLY